MERGEKQYQEVLNFWKSRLNNRLWRLEHLYWIKNVDGIVIPFRPNEVQRKFLERQHGRNAILKARQLGLSTLVGVLMADFVFWNENKTAAIIDWRLPEGQKKLLGVRFQWEHLDYVPEGAERERRIIAWLMREKKRRLGTVKKDGSIVPVTATANKLAFRNGSVIYTDNTFRGGTTQFMHVSELAKMAKRFPDRAREVVNGGFESVPTNGTIIVESTHEGGRSGVNYNLMKTAMSKLGKPLLPVDWRFFFFPWYEESRYQLDVPEGYVFRDETIEYFNRMKEVYGVDVPESARLWWEWKNGQSDFNMGEEYPTVPDEAFDAIGDDAIYCAQFRKLRRDNRIGCRFVVHSYAPVYCTWDIGVADHMATVFSRRWEGKPALLEGFRPRSHACWICWQGSGILSRRTGLRCFAICFPMTAGIIPLMTERRINRLWKKTDAGMSDWFRRREASGYPLVKCVLFSLPRSGMNDAAKGLKTAVRKGFRDCLIAWKAIMWIRTGRLIMMIVPILQTLSGCLLRPPATV